MMITNHMHASERIIVHKDGIERVYSAEDIVLRNGNQSITMQYNFSQRSFIENNQTNSMTCPQVAAPAPVYIPKEPTWTEQAREQIVEFFWNPLSFAALAATAYIAYYAKSKFSLYSLGKACIEKAVWSLWKNKIEADDESEQIDAALLVHILQAYGTDHYTTAIARFLQDVEDEEDSLNEYIAIAKNTQEGILRFIFEDLSTQIRQAEERLSVLHRLKKIVMKWLRKDIMIADE